MENFLPLIAIASLVQQRLELQRLRAFRDVEVASLVKAATQQLKDEVEQMKSLLHSTSCQLHQAVAEKENSSTMQRWLKVPWHLACKAKMTLA